MKLLLSILFAFVILFGLQACKKSPAANENETQLYSFRYTDSILYLKNQSADYIVYPTEQRSGKYTGFPEGIEIDEKTGAINVSKSESGLRYRITHTSPAGVATSTLIVISGITFTDRFYRFSAGDSIAKPVYNANIQRILPLSGSVFDDGNGANSGGCSVRTDSGTINLAKTVRNGVFGSTPVNDQRRDFEIIYKINDPSNHSSNKLKVRLYYYNTMADVPQDLLQTLSDRENEGVFIGGKNGDPNAGNFTAQNAKPRPPCVIIIAH